MNCRVGLLAVCLAVVSAARADEPLEAMSASAELASGLSLQGMQGHAPYRAPGGKNPDPWERYNRAVWSFNDFFDRHLLKPTAKGYRDITPPRLRTSFNHFFNNLRAPVIVINDLLQGKARAAGSDSLRFLVNTTAGIGGFFDVSTRMGLAQNDEDFGQTLGVWGVPAGPYFMLPFLGPSTVRDTVGFAGDTFMQPAFYVVENEVSIALSAAKVVHVRANFLDMEDIIKGDRYLFLRDLYLQHREYGVKDGRMETDPFLDDSSFEDEDASGEPAPEGGEGEVPAPVPAEGSGEAAPAPAPSDDPAVPEGEPQ